MVSSNFSQFNMFGLDQLWSGGFSYGNCGNFMGSNMPSVFNQLGFGNNFQNCDGTYNYSAMAGMAVGNVFMNVLGGIIRTTAEDKAAHRAEEATQTPDAIRASYNEKISAKLKELGTDVTEYNYAGVKAKDQSWYTTKLTTITTKKETQQSIINNATNDIITDSAIESGLRKIITTFDALPINDPKRSDSAETTKYNEAKDKINKHEKALKAKEEAEKELNNIVAEETKLNADAETKQKDIDKKIAEIDALIAERDAKVGEAQAKIDDKILDKADGSKRSQTDYSSKFRPGSNELSEAGTATKEDLRYAIQQFRNTQKKVVGTGYSEENKKTELNKYKDQAIALYNDLVGQGINDKTLAAAIDIIAKTKTE